MIVKTYFGGTAHRVPRIRAMSFVRYLGQALSGVRKNRWRIENLFTTRFVHRAPHAATDVEANAAAPRTFSPAQSVSFAVRAIYTQGTR